MTQTERLAPHNHESQSSKTFFGFWVYLMTDCVLFSMLFATYAVLHDKTFGGPTSKELFSLPFVLQETIILLTSSFTCALAHIAAYKSARRELFFWGAVTFLLGLSFLYLELSEFHHFVLENASWERSAFLSAFFTLVGTHGLHITAGLLWLAVLFFQIGARGLTTHTTRRFTCFSMFWHFLDVVWIFIFTFVYLMGVL